jgi:demethylmenaquinone methyltransferase/2-methoxy-6-polyprenyl-1,4-benzoquinol methylase
LPGTRPAGAHDEADAARQVREMFSRIAPRYDFLNHLLSFQLDRIWRRRVAGRFRHILARADARVLDLCCGTGDLALGLHARGAARVFGTDFAHPMLVLARHKSRENSAGRAAVCAQPIFFEADALALPFVDSSFELAATAFGFRNLANYERGLGEMFRVLRPGGEVGILEFAEPRGALFGTFYRFYFRRILPRLGGAISGSAAAYAYLPRSVEKFPQPEELAELMSRVGFVEVRFELWTWGSVALHTARRP